MMDGGAGLGPEKGCCPDDNEADTINSILFSPSFRPAPDIFPESPPVRTPSSLRPPSTRAPQSLERRAVPRRAEAQVKLSIHFQDVVVLFTLVCNAQHSIRDCVGTTFNISPFNVLASLRALRPAAAAASTTMSDAATTSTSAAAAAGPSVSLRLGRHRNRNLHSTPMTAQTHTQTHSSSAKSADYFGVENAGTKNVVVLGGSYGGMHAATVLAQKLPPSHRLILIERNSHFNRESREINHGHLECKAHRPCLRPFCQTSTCSHASPCCLAMSTRHSFHIRPSLAVLPSAAVTHT